MTKPYTDEKVGLFLKEAAASIAPFIVFTYAAGYITGRSIHKLNDYLLSLLP